VSYINLKNIKQMFYFDIFQKMALFGFSFRHQVPDVRYQKPQISQLTPILKSFQRPASSKLGLFGIFHSGGPEPERFVPMFQSFLHFL